MKECRACHGVFSLDQFYVWIRPDGVNQVASYCRPCHSEIKSVSRRAAKYGLTSDELAVLLEDPSCGICGTALDRSSAHIDHDHATGNVRAVLCVSCNVGLGHFRDDQRLLRSAITYLKRHARKNHGKAASA